MLTKEDNEILTRVGPGTLMGNLLRRYWIPALLSSELPMPDSPPVRVRILCEDLVAFRDTNGEVGLFAQACPHRGASLFFGRNEEAGLRCVYHGWKFDVAGNCVDMPSEPAESNFKSKVKANAYPTHESGGIVWAYMGPPDKKPRFRDLGSDALPKEQWRATKVLSYCNWVQGLEGNIDSVHSSFLHRNLADFDIEPDETDRPGYPSAAMTVVSKARTPGERIEVQDTWYGFRYAGIRTTPAGHPHVRVTDYMMPFSCYIGANPIGGDSCLMMVPIDDHSYWRMSYATKVGNRQRALTPGQAAQVAAGPPTVNGITQRTQLPENDHLIDRERQRTFNFTGIMGVGQQDMAVTESMGPIDDRTHEHLGTTDGAVIRMRQLLIGAAKNLAKGVEPPALDANTPWNRIRSAEKILAPGEDWRILGTDEDPYVVEMMAKIAIQT